MTSSATDYGSINDLTTRAATSSTITAEDSHHDDAATPANDVERTEQSPVRNAEGAGGDAGADDVELPCCWWCPPLVRAVLVLSFLIGVSIGTISPVVPGLQSTTFGNNSYTITGSFAGGKGFLQTLYTPIISSFTDSPSATFGVLITVQTLSVIPYAAQLLTGNFWIYTSLDVVFGLYSMAFTLLIVIVSAQVPQINKGRTLALACNLATFMLGIGAGSFIGPFVSENTCFTLAVAIQLACVIVTAVFMRQGLLENDRPLLRCPIPEVRRRMQQQQQQQQQQKSIAANPLLVDVATIPASVATPSACPYRHLHQSSKAVSSDSNEQLPRGETAEADGEVPSAVETANTASLPLLPTGGEKLQQPDRGLWTHATRSFVLFRDNFNIKALCIISFFNNLVVDMMSSLLLLYLSNALNFSEQDQSNTIMIMAVANVVFVPFVLFTRSSLSDINLLRAALSSSAIMCVLYAVVKNKTFAVWLPVVNVFGLAAPVAVNSLTIDSVTHDQIGVATGVVAASGVAAGVICPFVYGALFQIAANSSLPGWPLIVAAASICVAIVITVFLRLEKTKKCMFS